MENIILSSDNIVDRFSMAGLLDEIIDKNGGANHFEIVGAFGIFKKTTVCNSGRKIEDKNLVGTNYHSFTLFR